MRSLFIFLCGVLSFGLIGVACGEVVERADWGGVFEKNGAVGTIYVLDKRGGVEKRLVHDKVRAAKRFTPASTFKIPHALFALDAGLVRDEFQVFKWDGVKRSIEVWNRDQNLRSSMRNSVVWVYEDFAKKIGIDGERGYLKMIGYGNADPGGKAPFWIDGNLKISAVEQVGFLERLYLNALPFDVGSQRLVKDVMIVEAGKDWILRAKSGWSGKFGWWVGWVEVPEGAVFFALNIDTPKKMEDLPKREAVVRAILGDLGLGLK